MAYEGGTAEVYKQQSPYPMNTMDADYWTLDRVIRWLDVNDFIPAIEVFKANHIYGKTFLDIDMSYLMAFQNDLVLTYSEKRKLAHAIKSLRTNEEQYQYRQQQNNNNSRYNNSSRYAIPTTNTGLTTSDSVIPLIPERKSSNNEQVLDWMKTFNIPKRTIPTTTNNNRQRSVNNNLTTSTTAISLNTNNNRAAYPISPSSPRISNNTDSEGTWKFVRRRPQPTPTINTTTNTIVQEHPIQITPREQQSIHVTRDSDTFHSLNVTGMHDSRIIKNSILRKLGLEGGADRYLFFHENGKHSEIALTDGELSHICQISDHSSTNRILVKSTTDHALDQYRSYSKDGTIAYDFALQHHQGGYQRNQQQQQQQRYLYAESRSNYNSDYDMRSRYDLTTSNSNGMISPINGNSQFTLSSSPRQHMEESRDDSGYFDTKSTSRKQSMDASADPQLWSTLPQQQQQQQQQHWTMTPQSQRSSTSSTDTLKHQHHANDNLWPVHNEQQQQQQLSFWAVPPKQQAIEETVMTSSQSLWAIPPSNLNQPPVSSTPSTSNMTSSVSLWAVAPSTNSTSTNNTAVTASPSLWAIPPSNNPPPPLNKVESSPIVPTQEDELNNEEQEHDQPTTPQFGSENLNLHPSISAKTYNQQQPVRRGVQFTVDEEPYEQGIESISLQDPPLSIDIPPLTHRHSTPLSSPLEPTQDEENWAERPSVERLYKDIDKYLPGHDLDKEIIVETDKPPTMVAALPPGRRLAPKKSIRNVAHEAHRNWRNAVNVIRANNLLRRRSTKMWHRTVEQVKPGMKANLQTDDVYKPKSKKLQWIRGELIGKGSFGRVYHALNVEAGEWIAVKQVDLPVTKADYANPQLRETKDALFREISLLEDLDNEYIVQYLGYDVDEDEGHINIFLEYVPGGSIASCLAKTGKFEVPLVKFFTKQILMGLAYLHNRNILHRDIKAGNILLDQNGVCKITDFGLSKLSGQDKAYDPHSNNSVMRGTVFWMAPEVVKGTNYNAKIDIWSLGCTVIEMLTGSHPWLDLNMLAALYSLGKYQAPPIPEDLPQETKDFLQLCFTINPEERPTAEQLLSHPFVQPDTNFEFKKYMKKAEIERRASKRMAPIPPVIVEN